MCNRRDSASANGYAVRRSRVVVWAGSRDRSPNSTRDSVLSFDHHVLTIFLVLAVGLCCPSRVSRCLRTSAMQ